MTSPEVDFKVAFGIAREFVRQWMELRGLTVLTVPQATELMNMLSSHLAIHMQGRVGAMHFEGARKAVLLRCPKAQRPLN